MRSITTVLPGMGDSFPLDPSLQRSTHPNPNPHFFNPQPSCPAPPFPVPPSPAMDLQYILAPNILLDPRQQQQHPQPPHPPIVLQDEHQLLSSPHVPPQPVPSSSRSAPIPPPAAPVKRPLAEHVHPNPDDAIIKFDSRTRSFPKLRKTSAPSVADPWAEDFLRDRLGAHRWETFSTRLFERRLGGKAKGKGKGNQGQDDDAKAGASAVEFLIKVEIVKEILRTYVPHPYNPLKSLTHPYSRAPSGQVTLTRSTVLHLSGWSNTQFSYWARRSEAVSVLAEHDPRLRAVGAALQSRLQGKPNAQLEGEDDGMTVTGKGLDAIVDEVKKHTGKSQFLRGKHSSLDAYGSTAANPTSQQAIYPPPQYAMPTFQAERYDHGTRHVMGLDLPPSLGPRPRPVSPPAYPKRKLKTISPAISPAGSADSQAMSDSRASQSTSLPSPASASDHTSSRNESPGPRATRSSARKVAVASDNNAHHFPVSDSRSEVDNANASAKRKPADPDASSKKRARTAEGNEA